MSRKLLEIEDLSVSFGSHEGLIRAVDGLSLEVGAGETVGLVGESGCGKTVTSLSVLGLLPSPPARVSGRIRLEGTELTSLDSESLRRVRGRDISMIFQEPMTSLNPVLPIGRQVAEPLMVHRGLSGREALEQAAQWLEHVKIPAARERLLDYPHRLSGGMRQRVMIAMALVCRPRLLLADEPTTALDVTIQAQILSLMVGLKEELGMAVLLITHDLGVVAQIANRIGVMYAGQLVEEAGVEDLFDEPFHPYTRGLLRSIPRPRTWGERLQEIPGTVPVLTEAMSGCRFADRCFHAFTLCRETSPGLVVIGDGHRARCWLSDCPDRRKKGA